MLEKEDGRPQWSGKDSNTSNLIRVECVDSNVQFQDMLTKLQGYK